MIERLEEPSEESRHPVKGASDRLKRPEPAAPTATDAQAPTLAHEPLATPMLTPEEQMALFEKDLKEKDWGHQPC